MSEHQSCRFKFKSKFVLKKFSPSKTDETVEPETRILSTPNSGPKTPEKIDPGTEGSDFRTPERRSFHGNGNLTPPKTSTKVDGEAFRVSTPLSPLSSVHRNVRFLPTPETPENKSGNDSDEGSHG
jgi:hypothetical protein